MSGVAADMGTFEQRELRIITVAIAVGALLGIVLDQSLWVIFGAAIMAGVLAAAALGLLQSQ